jgi:hypothetical protein
MSVSSDLNDFCSLCWATSSSEKPADLTSCLCCWEMDIPSELSFRRSSAVCSCMDFLVSIGANLDTKY